jgi:phospholipid N-methyltransferase
MATSRLPQETVDYLKAWMMSPPHINHPYPTEKEKAKIMAKTGIEPKQLTKWFENNRKRYWKPRVEAKLATSRLPQETVDYLKAWMMSPRHINHQPSLPDRTGEGQDHGQDRH